MDTKLQQQLLALADQMSKSGNNGGHIGNLMNEGYYYCAKLLRDFVKDAHAATS